jgi:hypothetical protein
MFVLRAVDVVVWMANAHSIDGDPDIDDAIHQIRGKGTPS